MNPVVEEMKGILLGVVTSKSDELTHYGMPRRSGRYPWGSGDDPYQHNRDFLGRLELLKKNGWKETPENVMNEFGLTTTEFRIEKRLANHERRMLDVARAKSLKEDGLGYTAIGIEMGINESTVRSLLEPKSEARMERAFKTADFIKSQIDSKGMIDVGSGVEKELGISSEALEEALYVLKRQGYPVYGGRFSQATNPGQKTTQKVICPPGTEHKEIYNYDKVHPLNEDNYISRDGGETFEKFVYPKSMDSKRLMIRYAEDGGIEKDGIIELRRGVKDLSLGNSHYSQVRILVDDDRYLKGMALYSDDMPDGVDVIFNTNKKTGTDMRDVLKKIKNDPDNPFGSLIKAGGQSYYIDENGNKQLSLINKRADEGDWSDWKDKLPSQFLSKQSIHMAKQQLDLAETDKVAELDEILSIPNPTIRKHFLKSYSDDCDAAAVHLQAAALPKQKYHVIIPINTLKENEVYAPNYENGTELALIRYPHGGTFEIPILKVNNKHQEAIKLLGPDIRDAVGIHSKVAERLSGADFDGDTVMCIPTNDRQGKVRITSTPALKGLEGFDPKTAYGYDTKIKNKDGTESYFRNGREFNIMRNTQKEMGVVSNLITDMTLQGASQDELAAAVRHSMVVIDAEKHKLDHKQSALDNNISALKKKYQTGGASTLISRAKGQESVLKRQGTPKINMKGTEWYDPTRPEGAYIYKTTNDLTYEVTKTNKRTGKTYTNVIYKTQKSTRMSETDDARTLISEANTPMEKVYANYANKMKSLANQARKEYMTAGKLEYSKKANDLYKDEVDSLMRKLNDAELNTPRERAAQRAANAEVQAKRLANPDMTKEDIKKISQQALTSNRIKYNASSRRERNIQITDKEWEAIQAGAITENKLMRIMRNADMDDLRERATPRTTKTLSTAQINRAKAMNNSNYTLSEIAEALHVSSTTVSKYLKGVS